MYGVKHAKNLLFSCGLLLIGVLLILCSEIAVAGAIKGLTLCAQVVIPALFAFMCLCEWVTLSGAANVLSQVFRPVFRLVLGPAWQGGSALLLCFLGGYPMGATALAGLKEQDVLSRRQTSLLSLFLFTPSPAFVITGIGRGMLGSAKAGLLLWCACSLSTLVLAAVGSRMFAGMGEQNLCKKSNAVQFGSTFSTAVAAASRKMLLICATVIVFSTLGALLQALPLPPVISQRLLAVGEVTLGCSLLCGKVSFPLLAFFLSFGGICTHMQVKGILGDLMPGNDGYFIVRLLQGLLSYGFAALLFRWFPVVLPTLSVGSAVLGRGDSLLPSVALLCTCVVFLSSLNVGRRNEDEKQGLYS